MAARIGGALRGAGWGLLAGAVWFLLEVAGNWAAGGVTPAAMLQRVAVLDVGIAAAAGLVVGAVLPRVGLTFGLAMAAVYGLLRLYAPPGFGAEGAFVLLAVAAVAAGAWLARRDGYGVLA